MLFSVSTLELIHYAIFNLNTNQNMVDVWSYASGLPWSTLVNPGLSLSTLVYPSLSWSILVYLGLSWSTLVWPVEGGAPDAWWAVF